MKAIVRENIGKDWDGVKALVRENDWKCGDSVKAF